MSPTRRQVGALTHQAHSRIKTIGLQPGVLFANAQTFKDQSIKVHFLWMASLDLHHDQTDRLAHHDKKNNGNGLAMQRAQAA
jgi:hypothetical protein